MQLVWVELSLLELSLVQLELRVQLSLEQLSLVGLSSVRLSLPLHSSWRSSARATGKQHFFGSRLYHQDSPCAQAANIINILL